MPFLHLLPDLGMNYTFNRPLLDGTSAARLKELSAITPRIKDYDSWYTVWLEVAKKAEAEKRWLDAASYYHGAEFYLPAGDVRNGLYDDFARTWALGMKDVAGYERIAIPYPGGNLPGFRLQGKRKERSTLIFTGGYDSFVGEFYNFLLPLTELGITVIAKVGDWVVTPRIGKPVEINALWYNALRIMSAFAERLGKPDSFSAPAEAARRSFARFVRPDGEGLYNVIDGPNGEDASIRPNQIFAASLPYSPLSSDDQARVVRVCSRHLLTAYGLRSLASGSPGYHPGYGGGVLERDGGYHQGAVWGWLLGPFTLAAYRRRNGGAGCAGVYKRRTGGPGVRHDR